MVGFIILAILLVSFILVNIRVNDYERRLVSAKSHRKILQEISILYDKILQREELSNAAKAREIPSISILKELSNIIPENIILNNLDIDQRAGIIKFNGVVYLTSEVGEVILTDFMEEMERSPYFKDINLESSQKSVIDNKKVALFNISCNIQK